MKLLKDVILGFHNDVQCLSQVIPSILFFFQSDSESRFQFLPITVGVGGVVDLINTVRLVSN